MMDFLHWLSTWGLTDYLLFCVGVQVRILRKESNKPLDITRTLNSIYGKRGIL